VPSASHDVEERPSYRVDQGADRLPTSVRHEPQNNTNDDC